MKSLFCATVFVFVWSGSVMAQNFLADDLKNLSSETKVVAEKIEKDAKDGTKSLQVKTKTAVIKQNEAVEKACVKKETALKPESENVTALAATVENVSKIQQGDEARKKDVLDTAESLKQAATTELESKVAELVAAKTENVDGRVEDIKTTASSTLESAQAKLQTALKNLQAAKTTLKNVTAVSKSKMSALKGELNSVLSKKNVSGAAVEAAKSLFEAKKAAVDAEVGDAQKGVTDAEAEVQKSSTELMNKVHSVRSAAETIKAFF